MNETVVSESTPVPVTRPRNWMPAVAFGVAIVAVILGAAGVTFGIASHSESVTLSRHVASQAHQITSLRTQEASIMRQLAATTAKLNGSAADVITCADLQNLGLQTYWLDSNYNLQSNTLPLPEHCINR